MMGRSVTDAAGSPAGKGHKKRNPPCCLSACGAASLCLLINRQPMRIFASPQPIVSITCYENNILCCFPAQETLYCVRGRLSIRILVNFSVTFRKRAERPCHAWKKKIRADFCAFLSKKAERIFSAEPVDFFAANDYDEGYGELFLLPS